MGLVLGILDSVRARIAQRPMFSQLFGQTVTPGRVGFSGEPTSISNMSLIIAEMKKNGMTLYRASSTPQWEDGTFHPEYIQYFIDNAPIDWKIIVDRNHLYPNNETKSAAFRANLSTGRANILDICKRWPNNPRVLGEIVNEYVSPDIKTVGQGLINDVRNAGYSNPLVLNKMEQSWASVKFTDPNTYTGFHPYFNTWSVSGAISQVKTALAAGLKLINTETGADYREKSYFTTSTVSEVNQFLAQCVPLGVSNCLWMNDNLDNWPKYKELGIKIPASTPTPPSTVTYTLKVQASIPVQFTVTNVAGTYTTNKTFALVAGSYTINMPASVYYNGKTRYFKYWGDGSTNRIKTVILPPSTYPYATYY